MTKVFGLPTHILLVHAPVALAPLVVVFCVAVLLLPSLRAKLGRWAPIAAFFLVLSMFLAKESGEAFRDAAIDAGNISQKVIQKHADLGSATVLLSFLFLAAVAVGVILGKRAGGDKIARVFGGVSLVVGVLVVIWTIRTGHEGAKVVWDGVLP